MRITTNYSKSDWKRAIPEIIISVIPAIFLLSACLYLYIPYLENWAFWLNFQTDDETLVRFINFLDDNEQFQTGLLTPSGWILFFTMLWIGGAMFPLWIIIRFHRLIPVKWIIKKLGIEHRMKLVVFVNGKPLTKVRQLFGR